jgi:hypothetical protein
VSAPAPVPAPGRGSRFPSAGEPGAGKAFCCSAGKAILPHNSACSNTTSKPALAKTGTEHDQRRRAQCRHVHLARQEERTTVEVAGLSHRPAAPSTPSVACARRRSALTRALCLSSLSSDALRLLRLLRYLY